MSTELVPSIAQMGQLANSDSDNEIASAFAEGIAGQERHEPPGIPIIRIDHKTARFLLNGEPVESVAGFPVQWFQSRAYWEGKFKPGEHAPPTCSSPDGVTPLPGEGRQADNCYSCRWAQWDSAPLGGGQACKVQTFLFLLNPEFGETPIGCLIAPPSSIRAIVGTGRQPGYLQRAKQFRDPASGKQAKYHELVWTRFALERAGDTHCILVPTPVSVAKDADEARAIAGVRGAMLRQMEELRGSVAQDD